MPSSADWLSRLLELITVTGKLEIRCAYGAPWRVVYSQSNALDIPYHVVLKGRAVLNDPTGRMTGELTTGDIVLLPHGSAHTLHDGSGYTPASAHNRETANLLVSENAGHGERLDMLCGRFSISAPHDRLLRTYLPASLIVRTGGGRIDSENTIASYHLATLLELMRMESTADRLGGLAMLNTLSSALFTLVLRAASEADQPPTGLLAVAGSSRLAPAIAAMFNEPEKPWTLPALAALCNMSRATFMRHFQDKLGRSANDLLTDIRMSMAANALKKPTMTTEAAAYAVGYQSASAFRRVFTQWMGTTPGSWRRHVHAEDGADDPPARRQ